MEVCLNCMKEMPPGGPCPHCGRPQPGEQKPEYGLPLGYMLHNRYCIGRALGAGGFGITYAAYDLKENRRTVIKECFPTSMVERQSGTLVPTRREQVSEEVCARAQDSFLKEAQMLHQFGNCNGVAQVYHLFRENGTAYFSMEFLEGMDLRERIAREGRLSWQELKPMVEQVLDTLEYLHGNGVIHRDIAPDNLFLTPDGVKLIDFGAARSTLTGQALTCIMKPGFAPVEQYTSHGQGAWTDIYALCATLYYCLTGKLPLDSTARLDQDELIPPGQLVSGLPQGLEEVLMKGMAVLPVDRYQNVAQLRTALNQTGEEKATRWDQSFTKTQKLTADDAGRVCVQTGFGWYLEGIEGTMAGWRWPLTGAVQIGRDSGRCEFAVPETAGEVSRLHCRLKKVLWFWMIQDAGSTCGTWQNQTRLHPGQWHFLRLGDYIRLGSRELLQFQKDSK